MSYLVMEKHRSHAVVLELRIWVTTLAKWLISLLKQLTIKRRPSR